MSGVVGQLHRSALMHTMHAYAGGGGGGYRGEDPVRSDMQGEGAEEEQGDQKSGRTRSGNEKEKRSKDKDKSKRKKEHKESKKRKKEGKREREMEGGEEEPAYEAYSPRGRSLDLREPGGSEHRDDLVKSTGVILLSMFPVECVRTLMLCALVYLIFSCLLLSVLIGATLGMHCLPKSRSDHCTQHACCHKV